MRVASCSGSLGNLFTVVVPVNGNFSDYNAFNDGVISMTTDLKKGKPFLRCLCDFVSRKTTSDAEGSHVDHVSGDGQPRCDAMRVSASLSNSGVNCWYRHGPLFAYCPTD